MSRLGRDRERERARGKRGGVRKQMRERKGWSRGVRKENKEEGEDTGAGEEDRVRPRGERVAAGQISVTPKSCLLKGRRGGGNERGAGRRGNCLWHASLFLFLFFTGVSTDTHRLKRTDNTLYMRASPHTQSFSFTSINARAYTHQHARMHLFLKSSYKQKHGRDRFM